MIRQKWSFEGESVDAILLEFTEVAGGEDALLERKKVKGARRDSGSEAGGLEISEVMFPAEGLAGETARK